MPKKSVDIGDTFGTWTVIGYEENSRKYNYNFMCQCTCGNKKVIRKDTLLGYSFAKCDKCLSMGLINSKKDLINSRWNDIINGKMGSYSSLDTNKKYSWRCEEGHTYTTSIVMLNEHCPRCVALEEKDGIVETLHGNVDKTVDFLDEVTSEIFTSDEIKIEVENSTKIVRILFKDYKLVCVPYIHMQFNEIIHRDKAEYLGIKQLIGDISKDYPNKELITIELKMDYVKDKHRLIECISHLNKKYL